MPVSPGVSGMQPRDPCHPWRGTLASGQEELILLQEKVKNGKLSMDEALEKFKHWQMGKTGLEIIQQVIQTPFYCGSFPPVQSPSLFVNI